MACKQYFQLVQLILTM